MRVGKARSVSRVLLALAVVISGTSPWRSNGVWAQEGRPGDKALQQQDSGATRSKRGKSNADMVITGDEEAPQVLTILPWQEPTPKPPPPVGPAEIVGAPAVDLPGVKGTTKSMVKSGVATPVPAPVAATSVNNSRTAVSTLPAMPLVLDNDRPIAEDPLARPLPSK